MVTSASKPAAVRTSSAAGRMCSPSRVLHGDPKRRGLVRWARASGVRRRSRLRPQVSGLGGQRAARLFGDLLQRVAEPGGDRGGHGALHERRLGEQDAIAPLLRAQLQGHLGGEDGAAQVHQDQDAVLRPHLLDGPRDAHGVGAERAPRLIEAAGDPDPQTLPAHLRRQFGHALGEPGAVADEDQPDHDYAPEPEGGAAETRASAAACISNHEEVAPGS